MASEVQEQMLRERIAELIYSLDYDEAADAILALLTDEETVERAGEGLEAAWHSDDAEAKQLPPIEFTPGERNFLARAALTAAVGSQTAP